jgi:hypothetical protein
MTLTEYKFIIVTEDYSVYGTNNYEEAVEAANFHIVFDLQTGNSFLTDEIKIEEWKA